MGNRIAALLRDGQAAARAGKRARARRKFRAVLMLDSASVAALLWLAWLNDDPRASLAYVARALACDPHNLRAHAALRWARHRVTFPKRREPPVPSASAALESRPTTQPSTQPPHQPLSPPPHLPPFSPLRRRSHHLQRCPPCLFTATCAG